MNYVEEKVFFRKRWWNKKEKKLCNFVIITDIFNISIWLKAKNSSYFSFFFLDINFSFLLLLYPISILFQLVAVWYKLE